MTIEKQPGDQAVPSAIACQSLRHDHPLPLPSSARGTLTRSALSALMISAMAAALGCVHHLRPEVPTQELPYEIEADALARTPTDGEGVVVFDTPGGSAIVERRDSDGRATTQEICRTPCVAELTTGEHEIEFRRGEVVDRTTVNVPPGASAYRRTLPYDSGERPYLGLAMSGLVIGGGLSPIIGPLLTVDFDDFHQSDVGLIAAGAFVVAALTFGLVSTVLAILDPQRIREAGAAHWSLGSP